MPSLEMAVYIFIVRSLRLQFIAFWVIHWELWLCPPTSSADDSPREIPTKSHSCLWIVCAVVVFFAAFFVCLFRPFFLPSLSANVSTFDWIVPKIRYHHHHNHVYELQLSRLVIYSIPCAAISSSNPFNKYVLSWDIRVYVY